MMAQREQPDLAGGARHRFSLLFFSLSVLFGKKTISLAAGEWRRVRNFVKGHNDKIIPAMQEFKWPCADETGSERWNSL